MTINILPAVIAVLLGLLVTGAVDFVQADGDTHPDAWTAFALALLLVARDALFGGAFFPFRRPAGGGALRPAVHLSAGHVRIPVRRFEPIATTLAILLGLLVTGAVDFGPLGEGAGAWGWTVFALSLALSIGLRLSPRPRRRRAPPAPPRAGPGRDAFAAAAQARMQAFAEDLFAGFGRSPPGDKKND